MAVKPSCFYKTKLLSGKTEHDAFPFRFAGYSKNFGAITKVVGLYTTLSGPLPLLLSGFSTLLCQGCHSPQDWDHCPPLHWGHYISLHQGSHPHIPSHLHPQGALLVLRSHPRWWWPFATSCQYMGGNDQASNLLVLCVGESLPLSQ